MNADLTSPQGVLALQRDLDKHIFRLSYNIWQWVNHADFDNIHSMQDQSDPFGDE